MAQPRILIVDDEESVRFVLKQTLRDEAYTLETASNGSEALSKLANQRFDLILLDLQMNPINGIEVLHQLRKKDHDAVVIILTAHGSLETAVEAIRFGAFDYLFKPADPNTIRKRVKDGLKYHQKLVYRNRLLTQVDALKTTLLEMDTEMRETAPSRAQRFIQDGNLTIDCHHRTVMLSGNMLELTSTEYNVLICLVKASPEPVSHQFLVKTALDYECNEREAREIIKWHIHHLRKKVEANPSKPTYIHTIRYKGYLWRPH